MSLEIILGPMFAGKSSRILSTESRYASLGIPVLVLTHASDVRYGNGNSIITHDRREVPCWAMHDLGEVEDEALRRFGVVIVDEAHFFPNLVDFVRRVVETHGKTLVLVGLDGDSRRRPFGQLLECIPLADRVERLTSLCRQCANGTPGLFSYRIQGPRDQQVIVGGRELYHPLCRPCFLRREEEDASRRMRDA
jgi:thymidine kinase